MWRGGVPRPAVVVLAGNPGRIAADLPVPLPDERPLTVKHLPEFLAIRAKVEDQVRAYHEQAA